MSCEIEFQLCEVLPGNYVTGRNCGGDLPVGITFTALCRRVFPLPLGDVMRSDLEFLYGISLRVDSIEAYRRQLDFISPGMTALIGLSGTDFSKLSTLLASASPSTYYSLVANASESLPVPHSRAPDNK